ncbi:MAG: hypothetical protein H7833_21265, partial [Magnetococcus sp. DMHC-1]
LRLAAIIYSLTKRWNCRISTEAKQNLVHLRRDQPPGQQERQYPDEQKQANQSGPERDVPEQRHVTPVPNISVVSIDDLTDSLERF